MAPKRLGGNSFYHRKGITAPGRRKPARRESVVYLADLCTCDHERHEHDLDVKRGPPWNAAPNFGRWTCRDRACTCPMFVKAGELNLDSCPQPTQRPPRARP